MIDTNVLLSALLFPGPCMDALMRSVAAEHRLVLSSFVVGELRKVVARKFPGNGEAIESLLRNMPYELVETPVHPEPGLFEIRDEKDYPVLCSAIAGDVDVFVTGDRDFENLSIGRPVIVSPAAFLERYP